MQDRTVAKLRAAPNELMAELFREELARQHDHEYEDWTWVSFADVVVLFRETEGGGREEIPRDRFPEGFDTYLPVVPEGDQSYAIATLPGKTVDFKDAVKIYLGPAWDNRIREDLRERALTGNDREIGDSRDTVSRIVGWNLTNVRVEKESETRRLAYLDFQQQGGGDKVVASWGWSGW